MNPPDTFKADLLDFDDEILLQQKWNRYRIGVNSRITSVGLNRLFQEWMAGSRDPQALQFRLLDQIT